MVIDTIAIRTGDSTIESDDQIDLVTLTRGDDWGSEAFRDAGEATFGGR